MRCCEDERRVIVGGRMGVFLSRVFTEIFWDISIPVLARSSHKGGVLVAENSGNLASRNVGRFNSVVSKSVCLVEFDLNSLDL